MEVTYRDLLLFSQLYVRMASKGHTLMPAGMPNDISVSIYPHKRRHTGSVPPVANVRTSNAVKSGLRNMSTCDRVRQSTSLLIQRAPTSKSLPHGRTLISSEASLTSVSYLALSFLSTIAVKPAYHWVSFIRRFYIMQLTYLPIQRARHMGQHTSQRSRCKIQPQGQYLAPRTSTPPCDPGWTLTGN